MPQGEQNTFPSCECSSKCPINSSDLEKDCLQPETLQYNVLVSISTHQIEDFSQLEMKYSDKSLVTSPPRNYTFFNQTTPTTTADTTKLTTMGKTIKERQEAAKRKANEESAKQSNSKKQKKQKTTSNVDNQVPPSNTNADITNAMQTFFASKEFQQMLSSTIGVQINEALQTHSSVSESTESQLITFEV